MPGRLAENLGLTAVWLATAAVGGTLLAAGSAGVAWVWLAMAGAGLAVTWLMPGLGPKGRHRGGRRAGRNVRPPA